MKIHFFFFVRRLHYTCVIEHSNSSQYLIITEQVDVWGQDPGRRVDLPLSLPQLLYVTYVIKVSKLEYFFG